MTEDSGSNAWFLTAGTSRYFFNYRHSSDSLIVHRLLRSLNISDSHIISWDAASVIDSPLNPHRGVVFSDPAKHNNDLLPDMDISAYSDTVSIELLQDSLSLSEISFVRKYGEASRTIPDDPNNRLVLFLSGHGGDEFIKFHDFEEIDAISFARLIMQMCLSERYEKLLVIIDTCQASTLAKYLKDIPNVVFVSSSVREENSYALHAHDEVGLSTIDRFSFQMKSLQSRKKMTDDYPHVNLQQLDRYFPYDTLYSHVFVSISNNHSFSLEDMNLAYWLKGGEPLSRKENTFSEIRWTIFNPISSSQSSDYSVVAKDIDNFSMSNNEIYSKKSEQLSFLSSFLKILSVQIDRCKYLYKDPSTSNILPGLIFFSFIWVSLVAVKIMVRRN